MYYQVLSNKDLEARKEAVETSDDEAIKFIVEGFAEDAYNEGYDEGQADLMGIDKIADEWIGNGEFDDAVEERARVLGMDYGALEEKSAAQEILQEAHRNSHASGPYGYEYCAKCS